MWKWVSGCEEGGWVWGREGVGVGEGGVGIGE